MVYKPLGKSSLQVSPISFGCMSLNGDDKANAVLLHSALDAGINYFDTADIYQHGRNETTVGKAFRDVRSKVVIATKGGNIWKADGSGLDWNASKAHLIDAANQSLRRLQTDYIDLYQLHGGMITDNIDETIEALELLVTQGKIRAYGISSIRPNVIREYVKRSNIVSVMMQYSLLDRRPEETCLELLHAHSVSVVVRGCLASGLLIDKPLKPYLSYSDADVNQAVQALKATTTGSRGTTQAALQFVLHHPAVTSVVVGVRTAAQLQEALDTLTAAPLTPQEYNTLASALPSNTYTDHR